MQDGKEIEPQRSLETAIRRTDQEPILSTGELNAGVTVPREYEIPQEAGEAGLAFAKESQQPSLNPKLNVPMTRQEAVLAKKGSVDRAITWLGTLVEFLFKKQQERTA